MEYKAVKSCILIMFLVCSIVVFSESVEGAVKIADIPDHYSGIIRGDGDPIFYSSYLKSEKKIYPYGEYQRTCDNNYCYSSFKKDDHVVETTRKILIKKTTIIFNGII